MISILLFRKSILAIVLLSSVMLLRSQNMVHIRESYVNTIVTQEGNPFSIEIATKAPVSTRTAFAYTLKPISSGFQKTDLNYVSPLVDSIIVNPGDSVGSVTLVGKLDDVDEGFEVFMLKLASAPSGYSIVSSDTTQIMMGDSTNPTAFNYPLSKIGTVRGDNPNGYPAFNGYKIAVRGILYGKNTATTGYESMSVCDGSGCISIRGYTSYWTYPNPSEGDSVEVTGRVDHELGLGRIRMEYYDDTMRLLGYRTPDEPKVVTVLNESTESRLIKVESLRVIEKKWYSDTNFSIIMLNPSNQTFEVYIKNKSNNIGAIELIIPGKLYTITGLGSQMDYSVDLKGGFQIVPRKMSDIVVTGNAPLSLMDAEPTTLNIYPNPVLKGKHIYIDWVKSQSEASIAFHDLTGRVIMNQKLNLIHGKNPIMLPNTVAGTYFLSIQTENQRITKRFVIEE